MRYLLPQAVTFTGIFFGVLSITWAPHHPYASGVAILVACACDLMDGRLARWTRTESAFGLQLDSLADIINCGVAPAFLVHCWSLHGRMLGRFDLYLLVAFIFVACAAGRLARFNVDAEKNVSHDNDFPNKNSTTSKASKPHFASTEFSGIPAPVGAMLLCTVVMAHHETGISFLKRVEFMGPYVFLIASLMISTIPFRSLKQFRTRFGQFLFFGSIIGGFTTLALGGPGGSVLLCLLLIYALDGLMKKMLSIIHPS
jgi:CDP-diacylglycerol--serine O-phosphatidyltransferase